MIVHFYCNRRAPHQHYYGNFSKPTTAGDFCVKWCLSKSIEARWGHKRLIHFYDMHHFYSFSGIFHFSLCFLENHFRNSTFSSHIGVVFIVFRASFTARFVPSILHIENAACCWCAFQRLHIVLLRHSKCTCFEFIVFVTSPSRFIRSCLFLCFESNPTIWRSVSPLLNRIQLVIGCLGCCIEEYHLMLS